MEKIRARIPWKFFEELLPFNAELLNGNAMLIRACGTQPTDGSILRSKEYLLFGHGMATLMPYARVCRVEERDGYIVALTEKCDPRGVVYWEVHSVGDQMPGTPDWRLKVSNFPPDPDDEGHIRRLIGIEGDPGQFMYLACPA